METFLVVFTHSLHVVPGEFILGVGDKETGLAYSSVTNNNTLKYAQSAHHITKSSLTFISFIFPSLVERRIKYPVMEVRTVSGDTGHSSDYWLARIVLRIMILTQLTLL